MSFVRLPRLLRTMTFKLAVMQTGLFAISAAILFAAVYYGMVGYATAAVKASVAAELSVLAEEASSDGVSELVSTLELRSKEWRSEGRAYLLQSSSGQRLAGSLQASDVAPGWQVIPPATPLDPADPGSKRRALMVFGQSLPDGSILMVAHDMREVHDVSEQLVHTFAFAAALTSALAILGGALTSLAALRRVEVINMTTRHIMGGDLNHRVPIRGTQDEFDRLASNLNEMLDRIQHLMEGLRQVSSDIAHDLRTPLTHLRQRLEAARAGEQSVAAYEAAIDATAGDTERILRMFAALLRIAQVEAGTRRSGFGDVDLSGVFSAILDIYAPVAEDNGQRLTGCIRPGLHLRGDRELLTQMLANLVENAIRHGGAGAEIALGLHDRDGSVRGWVTDTGPGIPSHARDKVFRRFYRLAPERSAEGSGLGLSLVRAVVELHDGEVQLADNRPGLRVELCLPESVLLLDGSGLSGERGVAP